MTFMGKSIWVSHIGQYNGKFIAETTITLCVILVVSVYNYVNVNYIHDIIIKSFKKLFQRFLSNHVYIFLEKSLSEIYSGVVQIVMTS